MQERLEEIEEGSGNDKALVRRFEKLRGEYELEEAGKAEGRRMEDALRRLHEGKYDSAVMSSGYWEDTGRFRHGLGVAGNGGGGGGAGGGVPACRRANFSEEEIVEQAALLGKRGFMVAPGIDWGADLSLPRLVGAMQELKSQGWPACFVFAYQEVTATAHSPSGDESPWLGAMHQPPELARENRHPEENLLRTSTSILPAKPLTSVCSLLAALDPHRAGL